MGKIEPLLGLLCLIAVVTSAAIKIENGRILDHQGRDFRFHGTNVVVKVPPYIPIRDHYDPVFSFSKEDMQNLTKYGLNAIRLGMMWAGVEPTPDGYNETYLDEMQALINEAGSYGIYTLIDFHQDILAQKFCGDGVPTWLIDEINGYRTFPMPINKTFELNKTGLPSWEDCNPDAWPAYYFSFDVARLFQQLFKSGTRLNQKINDFWHKVASRFRGNKYVIAYELINEPFVGNVYLNPALLLPGVAERLQFQHFYDRLASTIRTVDTQTPICFEPINFDENLPGGFSHPPGGHRFNNLSIYCYHYYNPPALGLQTIDARIKDSQKLGIPSLMSEYISTDKELLKKLEQQKQSWMYWEYKNFGKKWGSKEQGNKQLTEDIGKNRLRSYFQRVAGSLVDEDYDEGTYDYSGSFNASPGGQSILFVHYRSNFEIQMHPSNLMIAQETSPGYVQIKYTGSQTRFAQVIVRAS